MVSKHDMWHQKQGQLSTDSQECSQARSAALRDNQKSLLKSLRDQTAASVKVSPGILEWGHVEMEPDVGMQLEVTNIWIRLTMETTIEDWRVMLMVRRNGTFTEGLDVGNEDFNGSLTQKI